LEDRPRVALCGRACLSGAERQPERNDGSS
jgi:hypothetical protein